MNKVRISFRTTCQPCLYDVSTQFYRPLICVYLVNKNSKIHSKIFLDPPWPKLGRVIENRSFLTCLIPLEICVFIIIAKQKQNKPNKVYIFQMGYAWAFQRRVNHVCMTLPHNSSGLWSVSTPHRLIKTPN